MTKKINIKRISVPIDKLVTMAEMGLGAVRPLNKEKRSWINKLKKQDEAFDPILVTPIKDSGYYLLTDGWHRVQAAKAMKEKEIDALPLPADIGLSMSKANKILRDIDRDYGFKLKCSDIIGQWAFYQD
ncbi:MAG: hypothetical protein CBD62_00550 [Candidatus Pelagibacter sp. TMED202]|nr:MAG: hypothetical protein CBD62_00550 [Candidatus Pelagibacter sp. TMED202]